MQCQKHISKYTIPSMFIFSKLKHKEEDSNWNSGLCLIYELTKNSNIIQLHLGNDHTHISTLINAYIGKINTRG